MTNPEYIKDWEKLRGWIVERIHGLVQSEVSRVREIDAGAIRRDGGRQMNEEIVIRSIVENIYNSISSVATEQYDKGFEKGYEMARAGY